MAQWAKVLSAKVEPWQKMGSTPRTHMTKRQNRRPTSHPQSPLALCGRRSPPHSHMCTRHKATKIKPNEKHKQINAVSTKLDSTPP